MKILVPIKRAIDYQVKVRVKADETGVETNGVKMSINPFDEIALEEAIRLKEQGLATEVILVAIGSQLCQETLRSGLAMGADRAILIDWQRDAHLDLQLEPLNVAKIFQKIVEEEAPGLVLIGKQSIDDDCNQVGQMLAALLNWPQATFASELKLAEHSATVVRETDAGLQTIEVQLPAVVTADLRLNEPRYTSLPNIMKAKAKPLKVIPLSELNLAIKPREKLLSITKPPVRSAGVKVNSFNELVSELQEFFKA